jgi:SAM-dependent methyltransferase
VTDLLRLVRCPACGGELQPGDCDLDWAALGLESNGRLRCASCARDLPLRRGTLRCVDGVDGSWSGPDDEARLKRETAESFGYEWERFGLLREEWERNFRDYMQPHDLTRLNRRTVLDVGAGSGRHSREAAQLGARVVAVDLGDAIDVARHNLPPEVLTIQADADHLPLVPGSFDYVLSIGVLHHLPDPQRALNGLARFAKPGGIVHVYLYWRGERRTHRLILRMVTAVRRLTTRMPHRLLHALCHPIALALLLCVVTPYRLLRRYPGLRRLADAFPLKTYADYPWGVLVNDTFDRFSAPIENRYSRDEVHAMLDQAGLVEVEVRPHHGWVAYGRRPEIRRSGA